MHSSTLKTHGPPKVTEIYREKTQKKKKHKKKGCYDVWFKFDFVNLGYDPKSFTWGLCLWLEIFPKESPGKILKQAHVV